MDTALPAYAELHCLSNFSFLRCASHPEELVERAKSQGYSALALTDECSLAGVVRAHVAAKELRFPLIIGSEFRIIDGPRVVLLAPHREAYGSLSELITTARRRAEKGTYRRAGGRSCSPDSQATCGPQRDARGVADGEQGFSLINAAAPLDPR